MRRRNSASENRASCALPHDHQIERGDHEQALVAGADGGHQVGRGAAANAAVVPILLLPFFFQQVFDVAFRGRRRSLARWLSQKPRPNIGLMRVPRRHCANHFSRTITPPAERAAA